ncbi:MAG: phage holin family protein, partial [Actinobacteria bacterium]
MSEMTSASGGRATTAERAAEADASTQPKRAEASLGDLAAELSEEISELFRKEVELAKTEAREELGYAGKAAGFFGAAAVSGWLALLLLSLALAWLLDQELNTALS